MKLFFKDPRFKELDLSAQKDFIAKLYDAEKNVSIVRGLVVLLNSVVYIFMMDKSQTIEWLAWTVIVVATVYSFITILFPIDKKSPLVFSAYFTSGSDALLITFWLEATGGYESPFYGLWYISLLAIAMRFTFAVTVRTAFVYSVLYMVIILRDTDIFAHLAEVSVRFGYMFFIAVMGGILSKEIIDQIEAKIQIRKSQEEIRQRETLLQEARDNLEGRVKERTEELQEINVQLQRINEDIDNFVYSASHDLKAPVLNVEALLEILFSEKEPAGDFEKDIREKLRFSVNKMKQTIGHLAEVAKAQKEVYDDVERIGLEDMVNEITKEFDEIIRKENSKIVTDFTQVPYIRCSRTCLKSIMYNFLSNSIKYRSPERTPEIRIRSEKENDYLVLYFIDNGLGMDLEKNGHKLFAIFKRMHDHVEGAGIGLYTVKKMVEKYNGDIEVESVPGEGTVFKVRMKNVVCT